MNTATSITLHTIYQMHVPTANALIESYGTNKIKSQLATQSVGAILEDVTLLFRAYLGDLIPGRSEHDAKLREISICKDLVRQHIESLRDTGRTIGQLPESLPVAEDYTNAFTYLIALVDSINTQAPDNTMLKNSYHTMGWDYPEFQTFLAERHGADRADDRRAGQDASPRGGLVSGCQCVGGLDEAEHARGREKHAQGRLQPERQQRGASQGGQHGQQ